MTVKAREFRYAVDLAPTGELRTEDGATLEPDEAWTPEHLLLSALLHCSVKSLRFHAGRRKIDVGSATGAGSCLVSRRASDGRYAVLEATLDLAVELEPEPASGDLADLLARAERDCFVGASLQAVPAYRWTVNGAAVD